MNRAEMVGRVARLLRDEGAGKGWSENAAAEVLDAILPQVTTVEEVEAIMTSADDARAVADQAADLLLYRLVPLRPAGPEPVDCHTCDDQGQVYRIRGGQWFPEPCPDCEPEIDPIWHEWDSWSELRDDMRRGK